MIWAIAVTLGIVVAAGTCLALSRDLLRCLVGLSVVGAGVNLLVFAAGRLGDAAPPIMAADAVQLGGAANPLPQALVLTAIVIGLALLCFSLALASRIVAAAGSSDALDLRAAEPPAGADGKPVVEDAP